jgi:hypothetical protein
VYLRYLGYAFIALLAFVFTYITCPIWALWTAAFKLDKLPWIFSWVHTHDDNIYGAKMRAADFNDTETIPSKFSDRFKNACWWIWRNPNYGFNSEVLGLPVEGTKILEDIKTDTSHWTVFKRNDKRYFGWFYTKSYGKKYLKLWIGWQYHPLDGSDRYMLKATFNPFRSIK